MLGRMPSLQNKSGTHVHAIDSQSQGEKTKKDWLKTFEKKNQACQATVG